MEIRMLCWFCEEETNNGTWWEDEKSRYFYCIQCEDYYNNWLRDNGR